MATGPNTKILELVWASALFCGEGCASIQRSRKTPRIYPVLSIVMMDRRSIERFAKAVPHGEVREITTGRGLTAFSVRMAGTKAEAAFEAMMPHLSGTDKGDQILSVLTTVEAHNVLIPDTVRSKGKLTKAKADRIRKLYAQGRKQSELAKKYGVTQAMISAVVRNRAWVNAD